MSPDLVGHVAQRWFPAAIDVPVGEGDQVLVLYDADHTPAAAFLALLAEAAQQNAAIGVLPVRQGETTPASLDRFFSGAALQVTLDDCRFRLSSTPLYSDPQAPANLRRALDDTQAGVARDLGAKLLFLQGHSGPVDGSFGKALTLCSRALHRPEADVFFPCAGTDTCFRQSPASGPPALVDPRSLDAQILVLDGCGTFPVPGSIYAYEQSLLRGLMLGQVKAAILSIGVSATPLSLPVVLIGELARGATLGRAVARCNQLRSQADSPASIAQAGASPWILVGDPAVRVEGLALTEAADVAQIGSQLRVQVPPGDSGAAGRLMALRDFAGEAPMEIAETTNVWAVGGRDGRGSLYLWTGPCLDQVSAPGEINLRPAGDRRPAWRSSIHWLTAGCNWLSGLADTVESRQHDASSLRNLIELRQRTAQAFERALHAATPPNGLDVVRGFGAIEPDLQDLLAACDAHTAEVVAAMVPYAGARLSHLWAPGWPAQGTRTIGEYCVCGEPIAAHRRTHPLSGIGRFELSCPTCSLIGDVAADPESGELIDSFATLANRIVAPGEPLIWQASASERALGPGAACATLFDPYRTRTLRSAICSMAAGSISADLPVPADWPTGMSWTTMVIATAGRISMFAFDVVISRQAG